MSRTKSKYKTIYTNDDYRKDEKVFNDNINNNIVDWSNFKRLMINDICHSKIIDTSYFGHIKLEDISKALKHPQHNWRLLLEASEILMRVSPHYYRLNNMFSNMAVFNWGVDLHSVKESAKVNIIKTSYFNLINKLESMNLKHEFLKIMRFLPYQDIYCGLIAENQSDFFIQQIDFRKCKLYQIQDGLYNFALDLSSINPMNLNAYPLYVQEEYIKFYNSEVDRWYIPPSEKQICIKFNSQWIYPYPMMIGIIKDILDLDIYKNLKLQSARTDNYKAIMVKVPIDNSTVDKPLLTPATLGLFAEINKESMSDDIGLIHTLGSDGTPVSFKDSNNTRNNVSDGMTNIYDSSGVTQELFNGSSSGTAVTYSIENNSGFIYSLYRQFERWVNRYIKLNKFNKANYKFHFYIIDATIFNKDNVLKRYKESCTLGVPVVDKYVSMLDMTPSRLLGAYILHKDIFDFNSNFVPLASSYNISNADNENSGRPTNESKGELLSDSGEITADSDTNIDR